MGKINVLSELVANKIAAGEVVERPASVVKELIENALDAGAKTVTVTVRHGGKSLIRVRDDGHGMERDDAQTCLLRHATSKITSVEDIEDIATMGFRGEALPSIASVSRLTLTTRRPADDTATVIKVSGGTTESVTESVAEQGTTIEVADLFYNTPARKKFLKADAAEYNAIAEMFNTIALAKKEISFTLTRNDTEAASYPVCPTLLERIRQLFDPEFADRLYPVACDTPDLKIEGFIGAPDNTRVNRTGQKFFINGRPVQSPTLNNALSRAYEEFLEPRRFPVAVLFLNIEPSHIDVNVHPTKREVRIRNERHFTGILINTVRGQLREKGFLFDRTASPDPAPAFIRKETSYSTGGGKASFHRIREAAAEWKPADRPSWTYSPGESPADTAGTPVARARQDDVVERQTDRLPFGIVRVLDQLQGTYILAEAEEGLIVIDQHAAHERIRYEELLAARSSTKPHGQKLLFPVTLHLDLQEREVMEQSLSDFQKMGYEINPLGGGTFAIDTVPACMSDSDAETTLRDTLHELMTATGPRSFASREEELAAVLACKTYAVKAGKVLDRTAMDYLIRQLGKKENPHTCPHGRPTFFLISGTELEKRFKRT